MRSYYAGFSLIELLVVVAIMGAAMSAMTPSVYRIIQTITLDISAHRLMHALQFTRLLAVEQHQSTALCGATDSSTSQTRSDVQWRVIQQQGQVLHTYAASSPYIRVLWRNRSFIGQCVRFNARGFAVNSQGVFLIGVPTRLTQKRLVVAPSGRIRWGDARQRA